MKGKRTGAKRMSKPMVRRAKRVIAGQKRAAAKQQLDTKSVKVVDSFTLTPAQGVTVANYIYNNLQLLETSPTAAISVLKSAAYRTHAAMYDRVRINSIKVTVIPKANTLDQSAAQADGTYTLTGSNAVHTALDRDSTLPWLSDNASMITAWQQYPSYKCFSALKKFSRSYSVRYPRGIWLDTANPAEDMTLLRRLGLTGNIGIYASNLLEDRAEFFNEPFANVIVEYGVVFQGTKPTVVSVDGSGVVTIRPLEPSASDKDQETWAGPHQDISGNESA